MRELRRREEAARSSAAYQAKKRSAAVSAVQAAARRVMCEDAPTAAAEPSTPPSVPPQPSPPPPAPEPPPAAPAPPLTPEQRSEQRARRRALRCSPEERRRIAAERHAAHARGEPDPHDPDRWRERHQQLGPTRENFNREQRRLAESVVEQQTRELERSQYLYDWQTADQVGMSADELASIERNRLAIEARVQRADGSPLPAAESVYSDNQKRTLRAIRDDITGAFTACEWGRLWRQQPALAEATRIAAWGLREDNTCARDWTSQRARNIFASVWALWQQAKGSIRDHGFLLTRHVPMAFLQTILAPHGKEELHRNTFGGTHRSDWKADHELGYLRALEVAGALEGFQFGDRRSETRQCSTYRLRVAVPLEPRLGEAELAVRMWVRERARALAELLAAGLLAIRRRLPVEADPRIRALVRAELADAIAQAPP
jgi:hypothetical protein